MGKQNGKYSIYEYKDGEIHKITDDFDWIYTNGLVLGESNYFMSERNDEYFIYHKLIEKRLLEDEDGETSLLKEYNQNKKLSKFPLLDGKC